MKETTSNVMVRISKQRHSQLRRLTAHMSKQAGATLSMAYVVAQLVKERAEREGIQ